MTDIAIRSAWERSQLIYNRAQAEKRPMTDAERAEYNREIEAAENARSAESLGLTQVIPNPAFTSKADFLAASQRVTGREAVLAPNQRFADWMRANDRLGDGRDAELSLGRTIRGIMTGAWNHADEEKRALGTAGGSSGGYLVPAVLASQVIDRLRADAAVLQSGASIVPMAASEVSIARLNGGVTPKWRFDSAALATSDPTFEAVTMRAKMVACMVKMSRELLMDSPNVEEVVTTELRQALRLELDRVALRGMGAAGEPNGIDSYSTTDGINQEKLGAADGAAPADWDGVVDTVIDCLTDNAPAVTGMICHPRTLGSYSKLKTGIAGDKTPLAKPSIIEDIPIRTTTAVSITETQGASTDASRIYVGAWSEMLIGMMGELTILPITERFIDNMQVAFGAFLRADIVLAHTQSFGRLVGIRP